MSSKLSEKLARLQQSRKNAQEALENNETGRVFHADEVTEIAGKAPATTTALQTWKQTRSEKARQDSSVERSVHAPVVQDSSVEAAEVDRPAAPKTELTGRLRRMESMKDRQRVSDEKRSRTYRSPHKAESGLQPGGSSATLGRLRRRAAELLESKEEEEAWTALLELVAVEPSHTWALSHLIRLATEMGDEDVAELLSERLKAIEPF